MNHRVSPTILAAAAMCLGVLGGVGAAEASSGTATGRIMHFQNQGNFCPTTRNCSGAKYVESQYRTYMGVRDVKVYLRRSSDGAVIGQGATDANGYFNISWYDPSTWFNVTASYDWRGEHRDNRFRVVDNPSGQLWSFWTWSFTLTANNNTELGSMYWGSPSAPHQVTNVYDGAAMMWANSLGQTNRMSNYFTNVDIKSNTTDTNATPWEKYVSMNWNDHFEGFTIMHELGHVASHLANRDQTMQGMRSYCYGEPESPTCGHTWEGEEWGHVTFEEGTATALTLVALYYPWSPAPHTCRSNGACSNDVYNFETTIGAASCTASHGRRENNVARFHWDNYDTTSDYAGENHQRGVWELVDTIHAFDPGTGGHQRDEHWGTDYDGRSAKDFEYNGWLWGTDAWTQLRANCLDLVGDW